MRLSASGLWRAEACPASSVLPEGPPKKYRDATSGTAKHAELAAQAPPGSVPEAAFAYSVVTGLSRFLGSDIGRDYGKLEEGEIPGSIDLLTVHPDHVFITDWKSGNGYAESLAGVSDTPGRNLQMIHNALAAATYHAKPKAICQLVYLKTGDVKDCEIDALDLAAGHERLKEIWMRAKAAEVRLELSESIEGYVAEGPHCWRCSAEKNCPIKRGGA